MTDTRIPTSLSKHLPRSATTDGELHRLKKAAYHQRNVVTVDLGDPALVMDDWLKQGIINWANKQYGERQG